MSQGVWLDQDTYLANKAAQCNRIAESGRSDWTAATVLQAIQNAGMSLMTHYRSFGVKECINPNKFFDQATYLQNKANQLNAIAQDGRTNWTAAQALQAMQDAGMTPYEHFAQYGASEGVNPCAQFDIKAYLQAKAAQLNAIAQGGRTDWTAAQALRAMQDAGLDPVMHYQQYGTQEGLSPQPPAVAPSQSGGGGGGGGPTFTVTNTAGMLTFGGSTTGAVTLTIDAGKFVFTRGGITATTTPLLADVAAGGVPAVTTTAAVFATAGVAAKLEDGSATVTVTGATGAALDTVGANISKVATDGITGTLDMTSDVSATSITGLFSGYAGTAATAVVSGMSNTQIAALNNAKIAADGITGAVTGMNAAALTALASKKTDIALASLTGDVVVASADVLAFTTLQDRLATSATVAVNGVPNGETVTITDFVNTSFTGSIAGATGAFNITAGAGGQTITTAAGADTVDGGAGDDVIHGGAGNDSLAGGDNNDTLHGDDGGDTLTGGAGDDSLHGGLGQDTLIGGDGDDLLEGGSAGGIVGNSQDILTGGAGNNTFKFSTGDFKWVSSAEFVASFDTITDWTAGTNTIDFVDDIVLPTGLPSAATAGKAGISTAGLATFDASDDTFLECAVAIYAAISTGSTGTAAIFVDGGDSYLVVKQNSYALIKIQGVVATGLVLSGGNITEILT